MFPNGLTTNLFYACMLSAGVSFISMLIMIYMRKWWLALLAYLCVGFFLLSLPFKAALAATSYFGMFFLASIWPIWLLQGPLDFDILSIFPLWFNSLLFNI